MSMFAPAALESANVQITSLWVPSQFPVHSAIWTEYPPWNLQRCLYVSLCFFLRVKANSVWPPVTVEKFRAWTFYILLRYYVMPFPLRFQTSEVVFPDKSFGGVFLHCQVFSIQNAACKLFEEMKGTWIQTVLLLSAVPSFYHTFWKSKQFQPVCRLAWNSWERSLNMLHLQWSWHWSLRASHCKCWRRRLWAEYLDQTHVVSFSSFCTHRAQDVGPSMTMLNGVSLQEIAGLNLAIWNPTPWWSHLKKSRRAHFAVSSPSPSKARQSYPKKQT